MGEKWLGYNSWSKFEKGTSLQSYQQKVHKESKNPDLSINNILERLKKNSVEE